MVLIGISRIFEDSIPIAFEEDLVIERYDYRGRSDLFELCERSE